MIVDTGASARRLATLGVAGAGLAVLLIGPLQVIAADQVDPIRRTISEYALGPYGWAFDVGVVGLAVGSVLVLAALVRAGLVRGRSTAAVALAAWAIGLVLVVMFEKTNWAVGPSLGGTIHRWASVVAFVSLPVAAIAVGLRHRRDEVWGRFAAWSRWLGITSLLWFGSIIGGVLLSAVTGQPWWRMLPLGFVERGLALTEVVAVIVLGLWAYRAAVQQAPAPAVAVPIAA